MNILVAIHGPIGYIFYEADTRTGVLSTPILVCQISPVFLSITVDKIMKIRHFGRISEPAMRGKEGFGAVAERIQEGDKAYE